MIDLSNLKAPGWQRVVAELTAPAQDDRAYVLRLLSVLGQVSGARQAVFFSVTGQREQEQAVPEAKAELVWPVPVEGGDQASPEDRSRAVAAVMAGAGVNESTIEHVKESKSAASSAAQHRQTRVFGIGGEEQFYEGSPTRAYVLAVPIYAGLPHESAIMPLRGVATLFLDNRSRQALQTTLALVEVLAGYIFSHASQQALHRTKAAGASLELASRLIASVNTTTGFKACALHLVNDLARQLAVDRVALGWVQGGMGKGDRRSIKMVAISDTENVDRRMAMVQKLEAAMDECLDQEQPVLYPPPPEEGPTADPVLSRAVVHAHRELAASDARLRVASFPLRVSDQDGDRVVGVVLVEAGGEGDTRVELKTIELVQSALDLVAPVLVVRRSDDRNLALRAKDSLVKAGAWFVGPTHTVWKLVGVLLLVASLVVTFVRVTYRIGAPMEIRPREQRIVSVPFDGVLFEIAPGIESGKRVEAGELLAELDTRQTRLGLIEAEAQILQYEKEADEAMKKPDLAAAQQAQAKVDQARARRDRFAEQIVQAQLRAPIAGTIISPDIKDKVKASLKVGDELFKIADLSELVAIARVEDRDISYIRVDQTGEVSPKSSPDREIPCIVEQIVPLAQARDGVNAYEVRMSLQPEAGDAQARALMQTLRPGVEGQARFNTEKRSLLWIGARRIVDQARLWLWW